MSSGHVELDIQRFSKKSETDTSRSPTGDKPNRWSRATVTIDVDGHPPEYMTAELEHLVTAIVDSYDGDDHETVRIRDGDATLKESNRW